MQPEPQSRSRPVVAAAVAVTTALLLLPLLRSIRLPFDGTRDGIVSAAGISHENPLSDYLRYAFLLAAPLTLGLLVLRTGRRANEILRGALAAGFVVLAASWLLNSVPAQRKPISDGFHEGERLAFLPAFLESPRPFRDTFFIHGFGVDALPSVLAHALGGGIALTRAAASVEQLLVGVLVLWVLWEIACSFRVGAGPRAAFAAASAVVFLHPTSARNGFLAAYLAPVLAELALVLRFLRVRGRTAAAIAGAGGLLLPLALLYSYSALTYCLLLCAAASAAIVVGRGPWRVWLAGTGLGALAGVSVLLLALGPGEVGALLGQMRYWGAFGAEIWDLPFDNGDIHAASDVWRSPFVLGALAQVLAVLTLAARWRGRSAVRQFAADNAALIALLAVSLALMKEGLGRSDGTHVTRLALPALLLLVGVGLAALEAVELRRPHLRGRPILAAAAVAAALLPGARLGTLDPARATSNLHELSNQLALPDEKLAPPGYLAAVRRVRPQLAHAHCFFTLTSEGVWYYLLDRPSCSRFHQLVYARTADAQREVRRALERRAPPVVLFSNGNWGTFDNLSPSSMTPIVFRAVVARYRPWLGVGERWFWRRAARPLEFGTAVPLRGRLKENPEPVPAGEEATLEGWVELPRQPAGRQAVYARVPDTGRFPVAVARAKPTRGRRGRFRWQLNVPTVGLASGTHRVELFAYDSRRDGLVRIDVAAAISVSG